LTGERLLVTAGPSHEPIDPVRYLTNRSSGKMGYALARAGLSRGAEVTLVSGPTALPPPARARLVRVGTAAEMRAAVIAEFPRATAVIMAAAVSDYSPEKFAPRKVKKGVGPIRLDLKPNPDILQELGATKNEQILIGFAAETDELVANAKKKLHEKNLDLIVANDVTLAGSGFEEDTNVATILDRKGNVQSLPLMTKEELAERIFDFLRVLRSGQPQSPIG
jgi:phosphopantothenoylcysteine decarboxylase/phosphopantothenate--cysteine ligase